MVPRWFPDGCLFFELTMNIVMTVQSFPFFAGES